ADFSWRVSTISHVNLSYTSSTQAPTIKQLQETIDLSNPSRVFLGNRNLQQEQNNKLNIYYKRNNSEQGNNLLQTGISIEFFRNKIIESSKILESDTTIRSDLQIGKGAQLIQPVNMNGFRTLSFNTNYSSSIINNNVDLAYHFSLSRSFGQELINSKTIERKFSTVSNSLALRRNRPSYFINIT